MKNLKLILLILFSLTFSIQAFPQEKGVGTAAISKLPSKEKRFALIIGVDAYQKDISPLYGTVNDAKALRDVLIKNAGFTDEHIILMTTDSGDADLLPTRGNIIDQLDKLQRVVPEDGLILFSFSGHGVSIGNDAFIVPADGRIYQNADLMRERAIDVLRIRQAIQDTKVKQVIMFLDACRNDPVKGKGDADNNLTPNYAKGFSFDTKNQNIEAYATLYATSFGDRAYEFLDKRTNKYRGYFSYAIEEGLKGSAANEQGEVTLAGLIKYIEDTVKERVRINLNEKQIPYPTTEGFRNSDLVLSVIQNFNLKIEGKRNDKQAINAERIFWEAISKENSISAYEAYLRAYPKGEFYSTAGQKIIELKSAIENPNVTNNNSLGDNKISQSREQFDPIIIEKSKKNDAPCEVVVTQESVSIITDGGSTGIVVGITGDKIKSKVQAVSSSPQDVEVVFDSTIGKNSGRALYIIRSISKNEGTFTISFTTSCGKKDVLVKVR